MNVLTYILIGIIVLQAVIFLRLVYCLSKEPVHVGTFVINTCDPTKDLCTLQLDADLDTISKETSVTFGVHVITDSNPKNSPEENL